MNVKRFFLAVVMAGVATVQMPVVKAQSEQRARRADVGWAAISTSGQTASAVRQVEPDRDMQIATPAAIEPQEADSKKRIVGTWVMTVSPVGEPPFASLQTYNDDGTMTETSSLHAQLAIGPAHGVWQGKKNDYTVTFELFAFAPSGEAVGRLRVRASIHMSNDDTLSADGVVDFIQPDGTVIPGISSTPFTGTRVKVLPTN
jgi:hypothetical protein